TQVEHADLSTSPAARRQPATRERSPSCNARRLIWSNPAPASRSTPLLKDDRTGATPGGYRGTPASSSLSPPIAERFGGVQCPLLVPIRQTPARIIAPYGATHADQSVRRTIRRFTAGAVLDQSPQPAADGCGD